MKKRSIALLLVVVTLLSGCGKKIEDVKPYTPPTDMETDEHTPENYKEEESGEQPEEPVADTGDEHTEVKMRDNNTDSIQIADEIYNEKIGENMMFSPLSLNLALGLLLEGSEGQSKTELDAYLGDGYGAFAQDYMHNVAPTYNYTQEGYDEWDSGYTTAFEVANSVWIKDKYTISDSYKSNVVDKYDAEVGDFSVEDKEGTAEKVNSWCSNKTHQLINSIITPETVTDSLAAMLINSVYLESGWREPWDLLQEYSDEKQNIFTDLEGNKIDTQLICKSFGVFYENEHATAFEVPYINGMKFIGILPKEEGEFTLDSLDIPNLISNPDYSYDKVYARMPKLNFETDANLNTMLENHGLNSMFDEDTNDFISMTSEGYPIHVSKVIQKTKIELDENGTKAAAVTAMLMVDNAAIMDEEPKTVDVFLNRPFAFVIYDPQAEQIVFIGKVVTV